MILKDVDFPSVLKYKKLTLNEDDQTKLSNHFQHKISFKNVIIFLQLAKVFNLTDLSKTVLSYLERCFTMVVESKNFSELGYILVAKLLASSALNLDSELQVFQAADKWLSHNIVERNKFAKRLLLKVRLPLLSEHALKYSISKHSSFSENESCVAILKQVLDNKVEYVRKLGGFLCTHRYCNQIKSNIFIFGDYNTKSKKRKVVQIDGNNFNKVKDRISMKRGKSDFKAVCLKGNVYVFGGRDENDRKIMTIEKYSPLDKCWSDVADMYDGRNDYCICSFMDKIYVFGGYKNCFLDSTLEFDPNSTSNNKWKEVARMNQSRNFAGCAVFEGKILVSGGYNSISRLNTVESYDVIGNVWSSMANMINKISRHSLVVVKNKLFVIGNSTNKCEMYESVGKTFVALKSNLLNNLKISNKVIKVGNKVYVFSNKYDSSMFFLCYDVETNEWSEDLREVTEDLIGYTIVNIPSF